MTSGKEDYLKALFYLGEKHSMVTNKELADELNVSAPSVSEMIIKLQKDDYIEYTAYKGSRLTKKGRQEALKVTRYHRLWEVFLTDCLGYTWSEAHEEAHCLEHYTSQTLAQRLDSYLHYPAFCPHGSTIPHEDGSFSHPLFRCLSQLAEGETSYIRKVTEEKELMDYLQGLGIQIGMKVTLLKAEKYEGPFLFQTERGEITISYKAVCKIFIDNPVE